MNSKGSVFHLQEKNNNTDDDDNAAMLIDSEAAMISNAAEIINQYQWEINEALQGCLRHTGLLVNNANQEHKSILSLSHKIIPAIHPNRPCKRGI